MGKEKEKKFVCDRCHQLTDGVYIYSYSKTGPVHNLCKECWTFKADHNKNSRLSRNKGVSIYSSYGMGYISRILVAKYLGVDLECEKTDNYSIHTLEHDDYGIILTKGSKFYDNKNYNWVFNIDQRLQPDHYFCIGYNDTLTEIKCVLIIPNERRFYKKHNLLISERSIYIGKYGDENLEKWNILYRDILDHIDDYKVITLPKKRNDNNGE